MRTRHNQPVLAVEQPQSEPHGPMFLAPGMATARIVCQGGRLPDNCPLSQSVPINATLNIQDEPKKVGRKGKRKKRERDERSVAPLGANCENCTECGGK